MSTTLTAPDGVRLVVQIEGAGKPVLFLHGSGGGLHSWASVASELVDQFEVWRIARRGHGPSDASMTRNGFSREASDIRIAIDAAAAGGQEVHVVGASYGATLALHTALASTDNIASLALYEPPLLLAGQHLAPVLDEYRALTSEGRFDQALALFMRKVSQVPPMLLEGLTAANAGKRADPAESERSGIGSLNDLEALTDDTTDMRRWSAIDVPVLLMQGGETWPPVPSGMDQLAAQLPGARRVVWKGQSHFATAVAPSLVANALRTFFL